VAQFDINCCNHATERMATSQGHPKSSVIPRTCSRDWESRHYKSNRVNVYVDSTSLLPSLVYQFIGNEFCSAPS